MELLGTVLTWERLHGIVSKHHRLEMEAQVGKLRGHKKCSLHNLACVQAGGKGAIIGRHFDIDLFLLQRLLQACLLKMVENSQKSKSKKWTENSSATVFLC